MDQHQNQLRRRGRPRAFDRDQAIDTAMRLFWSRGYEATSIAELAEAMNINPPSLYAAFGDKKQLFEEAVARYRAGPGSFAMKAMAGAETAYEAVARLLERAAEAYTDPHGPPGCMIIHAGQNCASRDDSIATDLRRIRSGMEKFIRRRITEGAKAGELPEDFDARGLAAFFSAVMQGMSTRARDGASVEDLKRVAKLAMAAWPTAKPAP